MNFRNLLMPGLIVSLIKKYYSFFKNNSTSNHKGKQLTFAPVRVNNSMNLKRNAGNQNSTDL
ncbi:hypothetical protein SAMN05421813_12222 [Daejeonella rubra]|uniref:Uncharacterized protein n=1 Tax=Daejeonella rubra TaxID=990371 RepID=A0A1G9VRV4_9SPHI|nr:hypothetical protein SAMN05421813_12222 [Daejeonella rubra]